MQAQSIATRQLDAYRAGLELGEGLRDVEPEVVFLFSSIHYNGSDELLEGLYDALDREPVVIGATGDGFYETSTVAEIGASALGLNSAGKVRWYLASATGLTGDDALEGNVVAAVDRCARDLAAAAGNEPLSLCVLFADFHADAAKLVDSLAERIPAPTVGGLAGDDYRMQRCFLYANREVLTEGLVMLGVCGDLRYSIHVAGDLLPVGRLGKVTQAKGTSLLGVDDLTAMDFITRQAGKPLSPADIGISAFRLTGDSDPEQSTLRTIRQIDQQNGGVTLFGAVQEGQRIQFCHASPEAIVRDVREVCARSIRNASQPAAGLVISCAGRKQVLDERDDDHEVGAVREGYGRIFPLAGFPSFGEIGPRRTEDGYTRTLFHNMTYILLVFET